MARAEKGSETSCGKEEERSNKPKSRRPEEFAVESHVRCNVSKSMSARQKLETQLTENNIVKEELDLLDSTNVVYKLIGPVLVKQDLDEAKATVTKRLEYINGEIQRYETLLKDMEKKSEQHREVLSSLQQEFQRAQGLAVGKV